MTALSQFTKLQLTKGRFHRRSLIMTENEKNLINLATGKLFSSQLNPIYASIQNYRKFLKAEEGHDFTLTEATDRWVMDIEEPIMNAIYSDAVIKAAMGSMRYNLFFELLYRTELNGYRFSRSMARQSAIRRSSGLRWHIARMMA